MRKGSSKGVFSKDSPKRASIIQADELYTGWLQKQSHGPIKKLQSRFFEISGHYLKYYDSAFPRNAETLKGFFDLREVKSISRNGSDIVIWGKADQQLKVRVGSLPLSLCCTAAPRIALTHHCYVITVGGPQRRERRELEGDAAAMRHAGGGRP